MATLLATLVVLSLPALVVLEIRAAKRRSEELATLRELVSSRVALAAEMRDSIERLVSGTEKVLLDVPRYESIQRQARLYSQAFVTPLAVNFERIGVEKEAAWDFVRSFVVEGFSPRGETKVLAYRQYPSHPIRVVFTSEGEPGDWQTLVEQEVGARTARRSPVN